MTRRSFDRLIRSQQLGDAQRGNMCVGSTNGRNRRPDACDEMHSNEPSRRSPSEINNMLNAHS